tara:strand:+ start:3295 stop:4722 length:1428 start_codon:yes stop_codon:yes gene_type:complete
MADTKIQNEEIAKAINAFSQNKFDEAESICMDLLKKNDNPDANHIIGCLRMREKKFDESIEYLKKAIDSQPDNLGFQASLGCAYSSIKDYKKAINAFVTVIKSDPKSSQVHFYLGEAYRQTGKLKESLNHFNQCTNLSQDHLGSQLMAGVVQEELKHFDQAKESYQACIETYPEYIAAHINLGMCYLLTGEYEKGWEEYEWRLKLPEENHSHEFKKPQWQGESLEGKRLLIICEQGFGDTIQFIRFAEQLALGGAKITIMAPDELISLLSQQKGVEKVISYKESLPDYDFYTYMLSIPKVIEWKPKTFEQRFPYLQVENKQPTFLSKDKINIGLVTQTRKETGDEKSRSIDIEKFKGVFDKQKHHVISLDYFSNQQDNENEITNVVPQIKDFSDTANIIQNLDLVISVDTVVAHIAGSLGIKTLLCLPAVPGWRWDLNYSKTTPWYSSLELFRQPIHNDWDTVINEIKVEINKNV